MQVAAWREIQDALFFFISGNFRQALGMGGEYAACCKLGQAESHGPAIVGGSSICPIRPSYATPLVGFYPSH